MEKQKKTFEEFCDFMMRSTADVFAKEKIVEQMAFVQSESGGMNLLALDPAFFENDRTKNAMVATLKRAIKEMNGEFVAFVTEVWMICRTTDDMFKVTENGVKKVDHGRPAEQPDRMEVVTLELANRNGTGKMVTWEIDRSAGNDKPVLKEPKILDYGKGTDGKHEGRFSNWWD